MKKFFENFNVEAVKEFFSSHAGKVWFVIVMAIATAMAIISNHGYGHLFRSEPVETHHYYHHYDESHRDSSRQTDRKPWKMQKPSSGGSSSKSSSSGHK